MNQKAAKLLRKYVELYPLTMRTEVKKGIKERWKSGDDDTRNQLRADMEQALANPVQTQENINRMIRALIEAKQAAESASSEAEE